MKNVHRFLWEITRKYLREFVGQLTNIISIKEELNKLEGDIRGETKETSTR